MQFHAETFYQSFAFSVFQAGQVQRTRRSIRESRRLRCPSATTRGDLIQEDIDMPFAGDLFPPIAPSAPKRARLLPPASLSPTTSKATTFVWCARDYERIIKREKKKARAFFETNSATVRVSGFGHTKEFKLPKTTNTKKQMKEIFGVLQSLCVGTTIPARTFNKRSFGDV